MAATNGRPRTPTIDEIFDMSARLFEMHGFRNVTMQDVADRLAITKPMLYVYASNKARILEGIFERVMRECEQTVLDALGRSQSEEQLQFLIDGWVSAATRRPAYYRVVSSNLADLSDPSAHAYMRWSSEVVHRLKAMVMAGQQAGVFRRDLDPSVVAFSIVAIPNWTARWYKASGPLSPEDVIGHQWQLIRSGLLARGAVDTRNFRSPVAEPRRLTRLSTLSISEDGSLEY